MASPQQLQQMERQDWDQTKRPTIYGLAAMFLFLATFGVVLRCLSSIRQYRKIFLDDFFMVLALLISYIVAVIYIWIAARYGLGLHFYRVLAEHPASDIISIFRGFWATSVIVGPWLFCIKMSLLIYYRRLLHVEQNWFKWAWWANFIFVAGWVIGTTLYYIFQCVPPQYYWEKFYAALHATPPHPVHGSCAGGAGRKDEIVSSIPLIISLVSDLGILALPIAAVSELRLSLRKKIGVTIVFSVGALACVCEILRIWSDATADEAFADPTWGSVTFLYLNVAEGNTAIFAACMPHMVSQYRFMASKWAGTRFDPAKIKYAGYSLRRLFSRVKNRSAKRSSDSDETPKEAVVLEQYSEVKAPQKDGRETITSRTGLTGTATVDSGYGT